MDARGVGADAVPMAVSDSESTDEGAGVAALPQHASKVVAVNPFFLERHLGPRATHPDGSANVRAQLTTLWVLGEPARPQREPPVDVPALATLGERERPWCSCLPTRCGPCHGGPASEPPSGSFDWADESDTTDAFSRRVRCVPTAACALGRVDDDDDDGDDDDDAPDPVSAAVVAESRRPARPSRDVDGCLVGCDASDWSEYSDGTRRRRGREGCLAGCDGDKDPITARRSRGCLSPAFDLVDGVRDPKTGERRGGCYARMFGEPNPETGARRGGCLAPIVGCVAADADVDSDSKKDPNRPPRRRLRERRRGGCLGDACVGAEDSETGARRGGCLAPCVGDEDPETGRRRGGCLTARLFGSEDRDGSRRDDGCLAGCDDDTLSDDSDPDAKTHEDEGQEGRGVPRRRGCLADAFRAACGVGASARRRRRRRRRDGDGGDEDEDEEGRGDEKGKEEKGTRRRPAKKKNDASSSSEWAETKWRRKPSGYLDVRDAALGARTRAPRVAYDFAKPSAVLSALLAAFFAPATWRLLSRLVDVTRERPARDSLPARDSPPPLPRHATAEARRARARDAEEALVDALARRTLPFLLNRDVEILGATLGAVFFATSIDVSVREGRKEEMFWLAALFPQWLAAARDESRRLRRRRDDVVRTRRRARRRRKRLADEEKWEDVLAMKTSATEEAATSAMKTSTREGDDDDDETGSDPKRRGWNWPSFALPSASLPSIALPSFALPSVSLPDLRDAEIEWHSQTNPDNDSRVDYDATVDAALRASVRRHKRQNRKSRAYCAGDADASRTAAKPVDDLKRDDDVDRTIGPTWKAASRVDAELVD